MGLDYNVQLIFGYIIDHSQIDYDKLIKSLFLKNVLEKEQEMILADIEVYINEYLKNNHSDYPLEAEFIQDELTESYLILQFTNFKIQEKVAAEKCTQNVDNLAKCLNQLNLDPFYEILEILNQDKEDPKFIATLSVS